MQVYEFSAFSEDFWLMLRVEVETNSWGAEQMCCVERVFEYCVCILALLGSCICGLALNRISWPGQSKVQESLLFCAWKQRYWQCGWDWWAFSSISFLTKEYQSISWKLWKQIVLPMWRASSQHVLLCKGFFCTFYALFSGQKDWKSTTGGCTAMTA